MDARSRWTITGPAVKRGRRSYFPVRCSCGTEKLVRSDALRAGATLSCGCLSSEVQKRRMTKHGQAAYPTRTGTYRSWVAARSRCNSPRDEHYPDYGGRGIRFKLGTFENFFKVLGPRPEGKTLDRINNDGHYEAGNVRWATPKEQGANKRNRWRKRCS